VFVKTPSGPFQPGSVWGEPNNDVAADFTRKAAESPSLFFQVGERGRDAVTGKLNAEAVARDIDSHFAEIGCRRNHS
jgi:hypothetical protein